MERPALDPAQPGCFAAAKPRALAISGIIRVCRKGWGIPMVKINGVDTNPPRWPDGSYSVQGAAAALGVTPQTVFKWLRKGRLIGRQLTKGQPWQIILPNGQITP